MVHLPALPGSALHMLSMDEIIERAIADGITLREAGFGAVMIENFGDVPFSADRASPTCLASMAVVADRVRNEVGLPLGVNVLRNDALGALGVAAAAGGSFVRVNVHTGVSATDQGMISGRAHDTLAYRKLLGKRIAIFADVHVKHATPVSEPDIARAAKDTAYRGLADALIVSGEATGSAVDCQQLARVREAVPDRNLLVGSGATAETIGQLLKIADGVIVGTALKSGGDPSNPIDEKTAREFVESARGRKDA